MPPPAGLDRYPAHERETLNPMKRAATLAATAALMGGAAMLASATAGAATTGYVANGTYQFASNTGQPGLASSQDTYWHVSSSPLGYKQASQAIAADGVDLSVTPDVPATATGSAYADSGVIVDLGTVAANSDSDGNLTVPKVTGSSNLAVNIYFDTNGDGTYFRFNQDGIYEGSAGDKYVLSPSGTVPAATVTADENATEGSKTEVWAWVGIAATSTDGKTTTGNVASVAGIPLTVSYSGTGRISNAHSHKCMDVTGGAYKAGTGIQQWTCGAKAPDGKAGGDQNFRIASYSDGTSYLQAVSGSLVLNVASLGASDAVRQLTLETPGSGTGNQVMAKDGPYYTWPGDALVADVPGFSADSGAPVNGHPLNRGANQQWSMP